MTNTKKKISMIVITILMVLTSIFATVNSTSHSVEADLDPASKILCQFETGEMIVNFYSTDLFYYMFRSKSAITTTQDVSSSWLNKLLVIGGYDFEKTNEAILGRPLNPKSVPEVSIEEANAAAPKVSAFDRFGMAGLKWSSYQGEWKYHHINACAQVDRVSPTTYGTFYEGRLEPKSTHNEVSTSVDPRSIQFNKGIGSSFSTAFTDTLSNALFSITKAIVTLTIMFVGLAFTDVTTLLGMLKEDGESGNTAAGIFTDLFNGIFSGFILITFLFTALYILYKGLIKRELRFALNSLIKTILIFIVAVVMAFNPSFWIGVPNKIATYGQAIVLNSMSGLNDDTEAILCTTNVASIGDNVNIRLNNPDSFKTEFEKVSENMRSMIGCHMWEILLFKPWVKGQFGADYEDLASDKVNNSNEDWVGVPSVPLGNGVTIDNWALFHLSTQTNAHAPLGSDSMPVIVNGVNSDWWRIVDAMSDYEEEIVYELGPEGNEQQFSIPVDKEPTEFWQSWVGNNRAERLGVAFISILFGIVGSIAPLVFGIASAVYGVGLTLLMMTSPIFLLLGTWSGKGDSIFLGWLSTLMNTMLKKMLAGLLLVLSLSFSMIIMGMISDVGFIRAFLLMTIVSTLLIKNKDKIMDILANVDFGGAFDPRGKANRFLDVQKSAARETARVGMSAAGGAIAAAETGQNVFTGARVGMQSQLRNRLYTSSFGMNIIRQADIAEGGERLSRHTCIVCHMPLGVNKSEIAYRDNDGNYYCRLCADEIGLDKLFETVVGEIKDSQSQLDLVQKGTVQTPMPDELRTIEGTAKVSYISHDVMRKAMNIRKVGDSYEWDNDAVKAKIRGNIANLKKDFVVFSNVQMKIGRRINPPPPPAPIQEYIDLALINMAWFNGRFDVIDATYREAWKRWYADNAKYMANVSDEEYEDFIERGLNDINDEDIDAKQVEKLMKDYYDKLGQSERASELSKDKGIYVYVNGKLVLDNIDIREDDELLSE